MARASWGIAVNGLTQSIPCARCWTLPARRTTGGRWLPRCAPLASATATSISELEVANSDVPVIVAIYHPIYSAYGPHPGSTRLRNLLEHSCESAGRSPDVVLTGHVHDYQRFSATLHGKQNVPFIVAGAGGYNQRLHALGKVFYDAKQTNKLPVQIEGEDARLEQFNDQQHGYLRITVIKKTIKLDYIAVPDPSEHAKDGLLNPYDSVEIKLTVILRTGG